MGLEALVKYSCKLQWRIPPQDGGPFQNLHGRETYPTDTTFQRHWVNGRF